MIQAQAAPKPQNENSHHAGTALSCDVCVDDQQSLLPSSPDLRSAGFRGAARADDDIALFDGAGNPVAYVAADYEMSVYLWAGEPGAYLEVDTGGGFMAWGFNGRHLGWFSGGVLWDHTGPTSCAVKERIPLPHLKRHPATHPTEETATTTANAAHL